MQNTGPRISTQMVQEAKTLVCEREECGCSFFEQVFLIKEISALVSPTGQAMTVPIQTFACAECGHVSDKFNPLLAQPFPTE